MNDTAGIADERLREIVAGCEGVTPGPWSFYHDTCAECERAGTAEYAIPELLGGYHAPFGEKADAAHIARLDPQTVSSMASELLAARQEIERLTRLSREAQSRDEVVEAARAVLSSYDECSGAEPSLSVFHISVDVGLRRAVETILLRRKAYGPVPAEGAELWQPIKTAPRDGSAFLATSTINGTTQVIGYDPGDVDDEPHWSDVGCKIATPTTWFNLNYFTHWHPLPLLPKSEQNP